MRIDHSGGGTYIKNARKRAGFTQAQLSAATGIDQASISRMENGRQGVTLESLGRIAEALGVTLGELVDNNRRR